MRIHLEGDDRKTLIARLGLKDDASNADIQAAVTARVLAAEPPTPDPDPDPDPEPDPTPDPDPDPDPEPDPTPDPDSVIEVDAVAFQALTARAQSADQLEEDARVKTRDELIGKAVKAGKFGPARRAHYAARYDSDPEGTTREIERMAANVVPVKERGKDVSEDDAQASDAYDPSMLSPQERKRIAQAGGGSNGSGDSPSRIHVED